MSWTMRPEHVQALQPTTIFDVGVHRGTLALYAVFPDAYQDSCQFVITRTRTS